MMETATMLVGDGEVLFLWGWDQVGVLLRD
jgi:hypothetical protein